MKIDAEAIKKLISGASNVIIMAHRNLDLDALGSSLGIYYLSKLLVKNAYLLIDDDTHEFGVEHALKNIEEQKLNIDIKTYDELKYLIDEKTILFVLDVHIKELTQNKDIINQIKNIILLDHHIVDNKCIDKIIYKYIDETKSSVTEIVIELLKDLDIYIHPYVATIMLAGIIVDTNHFIQNTTYNTYDAAAFLAKQGADYLELQYLLKEDLKGYNKRQKIISNVEIIKKHFAIAHGDDNTIYHQEDLAKASNELLTFDHISASFTIGKINDNLIGISARSLGRVDVQKIMEALDGGGHRTNAATQLSNMTIEEVKDKLLKIIYNK